MYAAPMAWNRQGKVVSTDITLLSPVIDAPQRALGHAVLLQYHGVADSIKCVAPQSNERIFRWSHFGQRGQKRRVVVAAPEVRRPLLDLVRALPAAFAEGGLVQALYKVLARLPLSAPLVEPFII